jgi:EVE domain
MRYWIGVASKEHVLAAVKGGFAQFGHGRLAPAKRPAKGDWIIYYSAKEKFGDPAPCQRFVAIGKFLDAEPKQVTQAKGFKRWRRRVAYRKARWLWPLHHHHEQHLAFVPPANPADAPAINVIAIATSRKSRRNLV